MTYTILYFPSSMFLYIFLRDSAFFSPPSASPMAFPETASAGIGFLGFPASFVPEFRSATWSCMSATSGVTTTVMPSMTAAGSW